MQINLSTRELRAFVALAEHRNFTRAAALCHLSQPAFSALIRSLEDNLGGRLFERTTRHVELTAEGEAFLDAALRLIKDTDVAIDGVRDHVARRRGRVALAVLPSLAAGWLPPLLARFHRDYPGIELDVADVLSDECLERVRSGRADFALASSRTEAAELRAERFCSDDFHVVFPEGHALAAANGPVRLGELHAFPVVQLARSSSVRQYVEAAIYPNRMRTVLELEQLSTVACMVQAGLGITIVPSLTLFHFRLPGLLARKVRSAGLRRQVFMVRRSDRSLSSAAQGLHALLMQNRP
ncbi:MAG: LysR family transcriptional regulator [Hydrogenophaga sp.]|jgi:LysR family transcriptional regulator, carnitine catabolism transcriptional activator|uniref:LysR family transcriptional regulator n=1 Tax=Hydrogenophaga sp. TaxID=1904254 RepID=UPI002618BD54|nr:LysR family transcriptional regulator [Hydrogenophaga sp.]MCV0440358.1 LysR family transcriptional regulator [Hydrogenophaga sp.]